MPHLHDFQYCGKAPPAKDLAYFLCCGHASGDRRALEGGGGSFLAPDRRRRVARSRRNPDGPATQAFDKPGGGWGIFHNCLSHRTPNVLLKGDFSHSAYEFRKDFGTQIFTRLRRCGR